MEHWLSFPLFVWMSSVEGSKTYEVWKAGRRGQKGDVENKGDMRSPEQTLPHNFA